MSERHILILPPNHTTDDSSVWRAAIARGMSPLRCQKPEQYAVEIGATAIEHVFYYGNTLHFGRVVAAGVPLRAKMLNPWWPSTITDPAVFGRRISTMTYGQFSRLNPLTTAFVKCVHEKWFKPLVCTPRTLPQGGSQDEDMLHVQDVVKFRDEVRCWVVDGTIRTWSYYRQHGKPWCAGVTEESARPEWDALVAAVAPVLPRAIVVDVGLLDPAGTWHVIEANEPWASGIYDCDPAACLDVIVAGQTLHSTNTTLS